MVVFSLALPACSWTFLQTLPAHPAAGQVDACDPSRRMPIIDSAIAVGAAALFVVVLAAASDCSDDPTIGGCSTVSVGYLYAPIALGFGWSAASGFVETSRCRAYLEPRRVPTISRSGRPASPRAARSPDRSAR